MEDLTVKIVEAKQRIAQHVYRTPLMFSAPLSKLSEGSQVFIKLESEQLTGSFKVRGAFNKVLQLSNDETCHQKGVFTASTGNHGIACLTACKKVGIPLTIYCGEGATKAKKQTLTDHGGKVVVHGKDQVEAEVEARRIANEKGTTFISPYNDLDIVAGQGTAGIEILEDCPTVDYVLVPCGGGGLIAGIARYIKQVKPTTQIIGCQPVNSKVMYESVKAGKIVFEESLETLSDGTSGGLEDDSCTFKLCSEFVDDWLLATEEQIGKAMVYMLEKHHKVVEGAAGVSLGAFLNNTDKFRGKSVVIVSCGGNVGLQTIKNVLSTYS